MWPTLCKHERVSYLGVQRQSHKKTWKPDSGLDEAKHVHKDLQDQQAWMLIYCPCNLQYNLLRLSRFALCLEWLVYMITVVQWDNEKMQNIREFKAAKQKVQCACTENVQQILWTEKLRRECCLIKERVTHRIQLMWTWVFLLEVKVFFLKKFLFFFHILLWI